jgi:hypothetical protein
VFVFLPLFTVTHTHFHRHPQPKPNIFFHIISQRSRFSKHILSTKCVFWFSLQLLSETFIVLTKIWRDIVINIVCVGVHVKCLVVARI